MPRKPPPLSLNKLGAGPMPPPARPQNNHPTLMNLDQVNLEDFEKIEDLGVGNGGVVAKVRHKRNNQIIAQKLIHLEVKKEVQKRIINELETLQLTKNENIVGYYGAFHSPANNEIVICMEHMDGRSLDVVLQYAGRLPQMMIGNIAYCVLTGLRYLHESHGIMHRDIKPSNILVNSSGEIKLCDFGVSAQLINSIANSFVGTRSYMAPERLMGNANYTIKSDVWSLGITFVELAIGFYPIPRLDHDTVYKFLKQNPAFDVDNLQGTTSHMQYETNATGIRPTRGMAIFELLDYIVSKQPPELFYYDETNGYQSFFSLDFVRFTNSMLHKEEAARPNLIALTETKFFQTSQQNKPSVDPYFARWISWVITNRYRSSN